MHNEALTKEGTVLFPLLRAFDDFYLAGGTALALQIGHRISVDFDLFSPEPIPKTLLARAKQVFAGHPVQPVVNNPDELTAIVGQVKVTFLLYPFPVLDPLVGHDGLKLLSVREIGATKAYSIGRRGTYKDYVDLYFILNEGHANLAQIVSIAERKFGIEFNSRLFTEQLLFMDDIQDFKIDFLHEPLSRETMHERFSRDIRGLVL